MICNQSVTTKIFTRGKTHYLRYRVPLRIQSLGYPKEVVKSLKTQDYLFAQELVLPKISIMQRIAMATDKALLKSLFDELSDFSYTDQLDRYTRGGVSDAISYEVDYIRDCMEDGCQPLHPDFPKDIAKLTSHQEPLKTPVPEGSGELYSLLLILLDAHAANAANGRSEEFSGLLDRAKSIAIPAEEAEPDLMRFSALHAEFLKHKINVEGLNPKNAAGHERYYKTLLEIIDEDKPINRVTRKDIRDWLVTYASLPVRNKKPYNKATPTELLEMEIPVEDLVSSKTVIEVKKYLQGVFHYAFDSDYLDKSPAKDLNLKFLEGKRRTFAAYTTSEVLVILDAVEKETEPYKRWLPFIAAYTGARRGELVQLRKQDVKEDADSGRFYFDITTDAGSLKTKQSKRRVPIHAALVEAGFLDVVHNSSEGQLFEVEPQRVTNWFRELRIKLGVPACDSEGNRKVFHSFRHTVITHLKAADINDSLQKAVVGHEIGDKSINEVRYTRWDAMPISTFLPVIDSLAY